MYINACAFVTLVSRNQWHLMGSLRLSRDGAIPIIESLSNSCNALIIRHNVRCYRLMGLLCFGGPVSERERERARRWAPFGSQIDWEDVMQFSFRYGGGGTTSCVSDEIMDWTVWILTRGGTDKRYEISRPPFVDSVSLLDTRVGLIWVGWCHRHWCACNKENY